MVESISPTLTLGLAKRMQQKWCMVPDLVLCQYQTWAQEPLISSWVFAITSWMSTGWPAGGRDTHLPSPDEGVRHPSTTLAWGNTSCYERMLLLLFLGHQRLEAQSILTLWFREKKFGLEMKSTWLGYLSQPLPPHTLSVPKSAPPPQSQFPASIAQTVTSHPSCSLPPVPKHHQSSNPTAPPKTMLSHTKLTFKNFAYQWSRCSLLSCNCVWTSRYFSIVDGFPFLLYIKCLNLKVKAK